LIPGLVNAHTHLDLTHIGPQPHDPGAGFGPWVDMIRARRHLREDLIAQSVKSGIDLSLRAGVVAVGDIAGAPGGMPNLTPLRTLAGSTMRGVSYLEFFGIGTTMEVARTRVDERVREAGTGATRMRFGVQPHAPNTVDVRLFEWVTEIAAARGLMVATHLAETPEERDFVGRAKGPQREFLERLGIWDDSILEFIGRGLHPVQHLKDVLAKARLTAAHVNDADDAAIAVLARTQTSVAYCPRASAYFDAERHFGPHRYQEMLKAGINVAMGTDSIVNLPQDADVRGLSILDEMRFLSRRDGADPRALLRMGTLNGAAALGMEASLFRFRAGIDLAGMLAIDIGDRGVSANDHPFASCLVCDSPPALLLGSE
jgi:cytosine/adenosine deaminase-related metal-dependent hydrolase